MLQSSPASGGASHCRGTALEIGALDNYLGLLAARHSME
jgi:hypothetical protein